MAAAVSDSPWLYPAPHIEATHLRGGWSEITIDPAPRWPIAHRNARGLHGAISAIIDRSARGDGHTPVFALAPMPDTAHGWAVYWCMDDADRYAGHAFNATLYDRPARIGFGPLVRMKTPRVPPGPSRVALETVTPVSIKSTQMRITGGAYEARPTRWRTTPTVASLRSALGIEFPLRAGLREPDEPLRERWDWDRICIEIVRDETREVEVKLAGKYGTIKAWAGRLVLDVNAHARFLLEVAARGPGLGSRVAFGFGRVKIEEVA